MDPAEARLLRRMEATANVVRRLPTLMAEYYANGGKGVGQAVVGDRFQGKGNGRFAPLSLDYFKWKSKNARRLNKSQKEKYGKGSKILDNVPYRSFTGSMSGEGKGKNLPILVLTGATRHAVTSRKHPIVQQGDTAIITFGDLPTYAIFHHYGTKNLPVRSPVEPNTDDMVRVQEFADRQVKAAMGEGNSLTSFGAGVPRII